MVTLPEAVETAEPVCRVQEAGKLPGNELDNWAEVQVPAGTE